jgi:ATP-binding cassette subfamily B protein
MPIGYFERVQTGEILSRITNDVDTLGQSLSQSISNFIWAIISMVGIIVVMLTINVTMTLIALMVIPLSALVMGVLIKISQKHFAAQQKYLGIIDGQVEETFSGHLVVKAFNREEAMIEEFDRSNEKLYESAWKSQFLSGLMRPLMRVVSNLGYAGVVVAGGVFCDGGFLVDKENKSHVPWSHTLSGKNISCIVTENSLGNSFYKNASEMKITPRSSSGTCECMGERLYLSENGVFR